MKINNDVVISLDMGGTMIKGALVDSNGLVGEVSISPSNSDLDAETVLNGLSTVIDNLYNSNEIGNKTIIGVCICTPGPFDYNNKMSLMAHKFRAIYKLNLELEIKKRLCYMSNLPIVFIQDSNSFLLGEYNFGTGKGVKNLALATLGTGLGLSILANGELLSNGRGSCYTALYRQPWKNGIIEDIVSGRGIVSEYKRLGSHTGDYTAKQIGVLAKQHDKVAVEVMNNFGYALGKSVAYLLVHCYSDMLVVGGQISKDFELFKDSLATALKEDNCSAVIKQATNPEHSALLGAGIYMLIDKY